MKFTSPIGIESQNRRDEAEFVSLAAPECVSRRGPDEGRDPLLSQDALGRRNSWRGGRSLKLTASTPAALPAELWWRRSRSCRSRQISIGRLRPRWQGIGFIGRQASTSIKSKPTHGQ